MLMKTSFDKEPLHTQAHRVGFGLYSPAEVKKFSVVKVVTPLSFNTLGHALDGGLYDNKMGPSSKGKLCTTCQQSNLFCPGHFGHIELPLPVIHPLFSKTLLQLFRLSCISCHSVTIPSVMKHLTIAQLKLLSKGFIKESLEVEAIVGELGYFEESGKGMRKMRNDENEMISKKLQEYVSETLSKRTATVGASSKNIEGLITIAKKRVFSFAKSSKKCPYCGVTCKKMMLFESRIIYNLEEKGQTKDNKNDDKENQKLGLQKYLTPSEAMEHLRLLYVSESEFCKACFPVLASAKTECPTDIFFIEVVPVPPPKNRPSQIVNGANVEHATNITLRHIVTSCSFISYISNALKNGENSLSADATKALKRIVGKNLNEKLEMVWSDLQSDVDHLMDRERNKTSAVTSQMIGLKQIIEKKEGLFRMNMMGKRVNFAARTVITPDPLIHVEEIGIPDVFAKTLTFPTHVTPWNASSLKKLIINGPNVHPGAVAVENELGHISRLSSDNLAQRTAVASRLLISDKFGNKEFKGIKIVYRHMQTGDYLMLNRQPSLHRPSIMAHRARVLYEDKVFRLHYANCKHYNADFDGDEMNAHFPQSHVSRAEAVMLANACSHYLTPKDGTPLGGLIQDHIVAAVRLTIRGRFFTEADYHQLVYFALSSCSSEIETEPPTILKPFPLWSGKQVISTIVCNLVPPGKCPLTFSANSKIKNDEWRTMVPTHCKAGGKIVGDDMSESCVIFRKGKLLSGVLDKVQLGATPYGLCHAFYELYGNQAVGSLLSAFSRLMTNFLQWEGFTLGVKDVAVLPEADKARKYLIEESSRIGLIASSQGVSAPEDCTEDMIISKLEEVHRSGEVKRRAQLDAGYKRILDKFTNQINKVCLPQGLVEIFPHNNLQLLVQSGAKGSTVNTMQMSCLLGQIELEGKRPTYSVSGRTLPSFQKYDVTPRAGGFIAGRFLTGIRPQEFFFHCMAGREGLIDTAVKTSRSGYLQRCLVKLLEGVVTEYDGTVRDCDGTVIQYIYGEDGLDVCKSQYLKPKQIKFLEENFDSVLDKNILKKMQNVGDLPKTLKIKKAIQKWKSKHANDSKRVSPFIRFCMDHSSEMFVEGFNPATGRSLLASRLQDSWNSLDASSKSRYYKKAHRGPDPVISMQPPDCNFSSVSENIEALVLDKKIISPKKVEAMKNMIYLKYMKSLSSAGDAVGVLAAQSIGEPSTQMTLNTFHFAGRGEMNVTLGIPRLREILMVASENIKTPSMDIPVLAHVSQTAAEKLRIRLTRVTMSQVLETVNVSESWNISERSRYYALQFNFLRYSEYRKKFYCKPASILKYFERSFVRNHLLPSFMKVSRKKKEYGIGMGSKETEASQERFGEDGEDEPSPAPEKDKSGEKYESSDEEAEPEDADATQVTRKARQLDAEYDEPEPEEADWDEYNDDVEEGNDKLQERNDSDEEDVLDEKPSVSAFNAESRVNNVLGISDSIVDYSFDTSSESWCSITIKMSLSSEKINVGTVLRTIAEKAIIHQIPGINRAFLVENNDKRWLKTEGINILALADFRDTLDLNRLHCNNVHTMARHYGVEAASRVIVKEMTDVFKAYGIIIDRRHLTLVADYMTSSGVYRPFNRIGIESSASPLQQMSFETVVQFLKDATLNGKFDYLQSPSSRLILGKPTRVGTGKFSLLQAIS